MRAAFVTAALRKEGRALLPIWLAALLTLMAGAVTGSGPVLAMGVLAYVVGAVALGAHACGHEYTHRTLGLLLTLPADRRTLLLAKGATLATMLLALSVPAWALLASDLNTPAGPLWWRDERAAVIVLLGALFIAPWLTMLTRSSIGGVVLTIGLPGALVIAGDLLGIARYGIHAATSIDAFKAAFVWYGMLTAAAVGAVASWRTFLRLESRDSRGAEIHLPRVFGASGEAADAGPGRRSPILLLLAKELRLQQMLAVVAALYVVGWMTISAVGRAHADFPSLPLAEVTALYTGIAAVLIGSMAIAEERQLGTHEWQLMLPLPSWQQWAIKAGTAMVVALLLGLCLPLLLQRVGPAPLPWGSRTALASVSAPLTVTIVSLTACGLYLSSLTTSGVRALVLALPVIAGWSIFTWGLGWGLARLVRLFDLSIRYRHDPYPSVIAILAGLVALLLYFAFVNHRTPDRSPARVAAQIGVLVLYWIASAIAATVFLRL